MTDPRFMYYFLSVSVDEKEQGQDLTPESYSVCKDWSDVYLKSKFCDSHMDCLDGSDEKDCSKC